ncbi:MAG: UDP-N-acetylmuramoyl-L-alanine--D-glutamate ligase [Alphaproteobacteria bacterium]
MIPVTTYRDRPVAVFGLARSGIAAAKALLAGGAKVAGWDDNEASRDRAEKAGVPLVSPGDLDWARQAALVLAPGVPLYHPAPHPVVALARAAQCPIIGDIELFAEMRQALPINTVVAITGTNGKSTTTALVTHIVNACGGEAVACGNIGAPVLELDPLGADGIYVIEISSYQIELTHALHPEIAVLLNITPDHLDRHGGMAGYVAAKRAMLAWQQPTDMAIVGIDDDYGLETIRELEGQGHTVRPVSVGQRLERGIFVEDGQLWDLKFSQDEPVCDLRDVVTLPGAHNWQNAACAYAVARELGYAPDSIASGIRSFAGLAHRLEYAGRLSGVDYYNDSKATNAEAAARALDCFENVHWILGGQPKESGLDALMPLFGRVAKAYTIGEASNDFAAALRAAGVAVEQSETLDRALGSASRNARAGEVVLLSPACASFDQYPNFEARGDHFKALVQGLKQEACA